jgi:hypothetical protein
MTIQTTGRLTPDVGCLVVIHSHFVSLSSPFGENGGAMNLLNVVVATITDTSFYLCSTTGYGGVIYRATLEGAMNLSRCCAVGGEAGNFGNVIYIEGASNLLVSLLETSMVQCGRSGSYADGGIYLAYPVGLEMKYLNATSCNAGYSGSAWTCSAVGDAPAHFALSYMNILKCSSGFNSIGHQSKCESGSAIRYSNFYENSPSSDRGVVTHESNRGVPLIVQYCIFFGTATNRLEFFVYSNPTSLTSAKFTVSSCVFSGSYPADYCTDDGNNKEITNTESYRLNVINTQGCEGINPASRSRTTLTASFLFTRPMLYTPKRIFFRSFLFAYVLVDINGHFFKSG